MVDLPPGWGVLGEGGFARVVSLVGARVGSVGDARFGGIPAARLRSPGDGGCARIFCALGARVSVSSADSLGGSRRWRCHLFLWWLCRQARKSSLDGRGDVARVGGVVGASFGCCFAARLRSPRR